MLPQILLIGIKTELATILKVTLSQQGYHVSQITDSTLNPSRVQQLRPDLIIMSLAVAGRSNFERCRHLSLIMSKTPIMLLGNSDPKNQITSLNACANDYMSLPFSMEEFLARVRARLRRISWEKTDSIFVFENLRLDSQTYEVHYNDQLIELTAKEFDLLKYLIEHPQQVLTHRQILDAVWQGTLLKKDSNILQVYIRGLRRKLETAGRFIQTVRGIGYILKQYPATSNL